jgi:hypothetical protein
VKIKICFAVAAAVASLLGYASVATATPAHQSSMIGGSVVDSVDHRPLGGVQVDVFDDSLGWSTTKAIASTMTKSDGHFSLLGLHGGNYHIELAKRGYALEIITGFSLGADERILVAQPFGLRTAIVTMGVGQAMATHL